MAGHLCIGGPKAGKRVEPFLGHPRFICPVNEPLPKQPYGHGKVTEPMQERFTYRLETFHNGDGTYVEVWIPEGQSIKEAMAALLAAYESFHAGR